MKPGFKIISYEDAKHLIDNWDWNKIWLKSALAERITRVNPGYLDSLDYVSLRHQGHRLKGVAKKILKNIKITNDKTLEKKVEKPIQMEFGFTKKVVNEARQRTYFEEGY